MSDPLRTLTFGDVEQDVWGAAWLPGRDGLLLLGVGDDASVFEVSLEVSGQEWRLKAPGLELVAAPSSPPVELSDEDGAPAGSEQACAIVVMPGGGPELQSAGRRGEHPLERATHKLESLREVSAWFEGGEAVAVFAVRAQKQRGQDQDAISAVVLDPEGAPAITDPRLSTTYAASGRPTRTTLELWSDDPEGFPRRFAGESAERSAQADGAGWSLHAELMRCHSRGRDGTGVYMIARPA
ncbi:MAG TPA: hypothetical protein VKT31_04930 [Solirubrobacteraceae bacterium]|nr:hypothetical protein [Solirubrobacteraceae bacterium]